MSSTNTNTNTTTTNTNTKPLTMAAVKAGLPVFFARTVLGDYEAAFVRGASLENFAASLAGCAVERAHSGNTNGLTFLRAKIDSATLAKKHAHANVLRTALALIENIKPASLKASSIDDYTVAAEGYQCEILSILVPPKSTREKTTPTNWRQLYTDAQSALEIVTMERDGLLARLDALTTV